MISGINDYVLAGYALIWVALLAYAWRVARRLHGAEREHSDVDSDSTS